MIWRGGCCLLSVFGMLVACLAVDTPDICESCDHATQYCKSDRTGCECNPGLNQLPDGTCVECNNHGTWNSETSKCDCTDGYTGDNCEPACNDHSSWNPGTSKCECTDGYTGDNCETDICDTCNHDTQYCNRDKTGCECNPGFNKLPDGTCVDICKSCNSVTQHCNEDETGCECNSWLNKLPDGTCVACSNHGYWNLDTSKCDCYLGYTGDNCETDFCESCDHDTQYCKKDRTGCECNPGLNKLSDGTCVAPTTIDCGDHGTLKSDKSGCDCKDEYTGDKCETAPTSIDCGDHGKLKSDKSGCDCKDEYTGEKCETEPTSIDCGDHGTLKSDKSGCDCADGYTGDNCETDICESCDHATQYCNKDRTGCECNPGLNQLSDGTCVDICESCDHVTQYCKKDKTGCECNPGLTKLSDGTCVETDGSASTHFLAYLLVAIVFCIVGYAIFNNMKALMGLVVKCNKKRSRGSRPSSKDYARLEENVSDISSKF